MSPRVASASAYRGGYEFGPTEYRVHVCVRFLTPPAKPKTLPQKNEIGVLVLGGANHLMLGGGHIALRARFFCGAGCFE